ncbi:MarR family winged helix-turn-helix transcriptional regulator [Cellulosimicrobium arenosum]|uniref:MarR family transcriptional regulator n=1 Tax=Cellulosimicrobium arenosum TaxID=2708133 RepID=A0A927J1X9_9MICO|nr:MarR family transcriptional regulator [Cellulosimicrobium arenosum]MBD8080295.1 MarR family transcriptional regulator [Cellulosimicrobium arenosum]
MDDNDRIDALVGQWADERPDLDLDAMALLARLGRTAELVDARTQALAADYGVNRGDGDVLFALRRAGAPYRLSPTSLARALLMTTGTMTGRLDRLETRGLIVRVPSTQDRRSLDVELTDEGRRQVDDAVTRHGATQREIVATLTATDRADLDRVTRRLITHLGSD